MLKQACIHHLFDHFWISQELETGVTKMATEEQQALSFRTTKEPVGDDRGYVHFCLASMECAHTDKCVDLYTSME